MKNRADELKKAIDSILIERHISKVTNTVTTKGELLCTKYWVNSVYRVKSGKSINKFIKTGNWEPGAIYSSPINGHILVGMERNSDQKITRYDKEGKKLQDIQWDDKGKTLYKSVKYITENIKGDICTSNFWARSVVVVRVLGEYWFSYTGQESQDVFMYRCSGTHPGL
ncbi:uncharacterized protein LOC134270724 [Saccostrea cucullata]|uniref:uncharacterized protein LOC134270724 n=1 Tax=Saccostrea cuccullata TaxID=36930 RepID=UPI002ED17024